MNSKKVLSIFLCLMMLFSFCVPAYADDYETLVTYAGDGVSAYEVTVPASLAPGESGKVKVSGTWASDMVVEVSAPDTVTLTNSLDGGTKVLGINFDGISQSGDNTNSILVSKTISVDEITNALFGTWSGTIIYTVTSTGGSGSTGSDSSSGSGNIGDSSDSDLISFTIYGTSYQAEDGMTWGEWIESDYAPTTSEEYWFEVKDDYYVGYVSSQGWTNVHISTSSTRAEMISDFIVANNNYVTYTSQGAYGGIHGSGSND